MPVNCIVIYIPHFNILDDLEFNNGGISSDVDSKYNRNELLEHKPIHMDHNTIDIYTIYRCYIGNENENDGCMMNTNNTIHMDSNTNQYTYWNRLPERKCFFFRKNIKSQSKSIKKFFFSS